MNSFKKPAKAPATGGSRARGLASSSMLAWMTEEYGEGWLDEDGTEDDPSQRSQGAEPPPPPWWEELGHF